MEVHMRILQFGKIQLRIMKILWKKKRATARELTKELNKQAPIAHSTLQTLLRTLEDKEAVGHDVKGRTFYFYPLVGGDQVIMNATESFIENIFDGSPGTMVSYLVKKQFLTHKEIEKITTLIQSEESEE